MWRRVPAVGKKRTRTLVRFSSAMFASSSMSDMSAADAPSAAVWYSWAAASQKRMPSAAVAQELTSSAIDARREWVGSADRWRGCGHGHVRPAGEISFHH